VKISDAFPSKYLKGADLEADTVFTIDRVEMENVAQQGKPEELKPIVYFQEDERGVVLNRTNSETISSIHGGDTDDWIGKQITLFATEVDFQGKQVLAIRVRMKRPAPVRPAAAPRQPARQPRPAAVAAPAAEVPEDDIPF
jgi:hypothetical protein